jgi:hypothetical protein
MWLSPVRGSLGGANGVGSPDGKGVTCLASNTETARNSTRRRGSPSPSCWSWSRSLIGIGAMIRIARSPLRPR